MFVFGMLHVISPSPAIDVLGPRANAVTIAAWNRQHGFADPVTVQYLRYIGNVLHGNFGFSYKLNQSVSSLFAQRRLGAVPPGGQLARAVDPDRHPARHLSGGPAQLAAGDATLAARLVQRRYAIGREPVL